jgi:hypothetical protein
MTHISELYNDELLASVFGKARVVDIGRRFREVVPDFPQGKGASGEINQYHGVWFLFVLSKVRSANDRKDTYNAISSMMSTVNEDSSVYVYLGELLSDPDKIKEMNIKEVVISKISDVVVITYNNRDSKIFSGPNQNKAVTDNIDDITVLKAKFLYDFAKKFDSIQSEDEGDGYSADDI